jgi:integrase
MKAHRTSHNPHVFPGQARGKPQSDMTMTKVVRDMHKAQLAAGNAGFVDPQREGRIATPHGFRSTFRDWVAETTSWPRELAETAIAHSVNSKTEASYQRGTMLEKRRELMNAWSNYCEGADSGNVVRMAR